MSRVTSGCSIVVRQRDAAVVRCLLLLLLLGLGAAGPAAGAGDDRSQVLVLRARQVLAQRGCEEALPEISRARAERSEDAGLALLEGECRIRLRQYVEAERVLADAWRLDPEQLDAALYLAVARYHIGAFDAAREAIEAAEGHSSSVARPQFELYRGLLLLERGAARDAALALERARVAASEQVEPVASYYAGVAWKSLNERELAREAFERVKAADPGGIWAQRAEQALAGPALSGRRWVEARAGLVYDSNAILRGDGVPLPNELSGQSDGRGSWFVEAGTELLRGQRWSAGVAASYAGSAHFDLHEFDTHYPSASLWFDRSMGRAWLVRLAYDVGHAWVDYEDFVTTQGADLTLYRDAGDRGRSELRIAWDWNDYAFGIEPVPNGTGNTGDLCPGVGVPSPSDPPCAPPGIDTAAARDRDGNSFEVGLSHRYRPLLARGGLAGQLELRAGYAYQRYWAKGLDYDYQSHRFELGMAAALPLDFDFELSSSYTHRPFDHASSFPDPPIFNGLQYGLSSSPRNDDIWQAGSELEYAIDNHWSVSARYDYIRNISNVMVFEYDRHLVGGYLNASF